MEVKKHINELLVKHLKERFNKRLWLLRALLLICSITAVISFIYVSRYIYGTVRQRSLEKKINKLYSPPSDYDGIASKYRDEPNDGPSGGNQGELANKMANKHQDESANELPNNPQDGPTTESSGDYQNESPGAGMDDYERLLPLMEINKDFVGMITIPGTGIQYPVVKGTDNERYLNTDFEGRHSIRGTIFMDYRNDGSILANKNTILYGHNMKDGSMFHELLSYKDGSTRHDSPIIILDTPTGIKYWIIFAIYVSESDYEYNKTHFNGGEFEEFLHEIQEHNQYQERNQYNTDVEVGKDDCILTLSTCDYALKDARFVIHARLLRESN